MEENVNKGETGGEKQNELRKVGTLGPTKVRKRNRTNEGEGQRRKE